VPKVSRDPTTFFHFRLKSRRDGSIYPRCGATVIYKEVPNERFPVLHIAFCSPMDNYDKKRGRSLCQSLSRDGDPNTAIKPLDTLLRDKTLNEKLLLDAIDSKWNHQLYEWAKSGTVLGPKKNHKPPNWMNFELVLTKKKRKKKTIKNGKAKSRATQKP